MLWLRGCTRCGGDLFRDWDEEVPIIACLQCGHILTQAEEIEYMAELAENQAMENQSCEVSQAA